MRRFTHTFPQRISALLLCLALCLGLLPATALAVAPVGQVLYVGGVQISSTGYWTTDSEGKVTSAGATQPSNNYIHYDAENNVLTLHNATIKESVSTVTNSFIAGAAIGVHNQNGAAELTITLEGTNTIAEVGKGIYVLANSTGGATLTITGDGSLNASASQTGIWVQSNSNNAALCVENAEVTASSDIAFKNGVLVQAEDGSDVSLTVNGGSLTASVNANIWFQFGSGASGSGTPTVTVSNNAIVRANGGIANNSSTSIQYGTGNEENGGIVFNGDEGTVYGKVELQEDLEIGEGESLTIGQDASLNTGSHEVIVNGGTLTGGERITGTVKYAPTITTQPTSQTVTKGGTATFTVVTSGTEPLSYQWQQSTDSGQSWTNIDGATDATYTTEATTTSMNGYQYRCVVSNSAGSVTSNAATLTVTPPVTGVTLDPTELSLFTGESQTLTATVVPDNATNKAVTWDSSNTEVATVNTNGTVKAVAPGTANITVKTVDGSHTATCAVTVTAPPEPTPPPYIPPSKPNWTSVARKLANAQPGDTVTVKMNGETEVPGDVWETIAGRDVTVVLDMGGNVSWTVDGNDVPTATHFADMDFGVDRNTTGIDVDVINAITGEVSSVQITLAHDGEFGFTLTLTAPLGRENAGYWANLYHYDENAKTLNYETSAEIQKDGTASLKMTHASQYAIIIDDQAHQLPFTDVTSGAWYEGAVRYAYLHDIMEGMSATTFQPNGTLSRAMAVQIFYNLEGQPDISDENLGYPYEDVNAQAWYGDAVYWARITGVATGYGDGTFQPTDSITRQEFAQMLYNYAKYKDYDLSAEGDLSQFPDSGSVADWAEIAMEWANGNELINGHDNGTIDAVGAGTRAQAASILMRFDQNLVEN